MTESLNGVLAKIKPLVIIYLKSFVRIPNSAKSTTNAILSPADKKKFILVAVGRKENIW